MWRFLSLTLILARLSTTYVNELYIVCVTLLMDSSALLMDSSECCVVCYGYAGMTSG